MTTESDDAGFEELLQHLKSTRAFDLTGYKRSSLQRRVGKRMTAVGIADYRDYLDYLEVHPDEFSELFNTILINVTAFFRDTAAWTYLAEQAIPRINEVRANGGQIRVWSAGCASGEEAYTAAVVFAEALGVDALEERVKVYATDADEEALTTARHGVYTAKEVANVPEELRDKYFDDLGGRFGFKKNLRRSVIFGRHDLVQDAPISRLDLLICRNTLMYFNSELQNRILRNFHFALAEHGFLFLGKAETMLSHASYFRPIDLRQRLFVKNARLPARDELFADRGGFPPSRQVQIRDAAIDAAPVAQIVVDSEGLLLVANQQARSRFEIGPQDIGRPIQDLEISYRPLELRSRIDTAYAERRPILIANVDRVLRDGEIQTYDVTVAPVFDQEGDSLGVTMSFADVTRYRRLRQELERANQELETAYEELQSTNEELETTNEELQSSVEELETTNEELQSSVEELETTNEELQSTNEELETTNEELQSTNTEIQAMNGEMQQRTEELNRAMALAEGVLGSLDMGVIVIGRDFSVQRWNERASELFGLRREEVEGQAFVGLDIGLPVAELQSAIRTSLSGDPSTSFVEAINRRGRTIACKVTCNPLRDREGAVQGAVILLAEPDDLR